MGYSSLTYIMLAQVLSKVSWTIIWKHKSTFYVNGATEIIKLDNDKRQNI